MGFFDSIAGQMVQKADSAESGKHSADGNPIMTMLTDLLSNPDMGGIGGLVSAFQKNDLGDLVAWWISSNANLAIPAEHIHSVLGQGPLQDEASKMGLSSGDLASALSKHPPGLVDPCGPTRPQWAAAQR
jgi:uncharacterized protein YidB (DUF937 family)